MAASAVAERLGRSGEAQAHSARVQELVRRLQTTCASNGCKIATRDDGQPLDRCTRCHSVHYCSRDCQLADWKARHKECPRLRKEHEAASAAAPPSGGVAPGGGTGST
jgi:hypothetical protein